MDIQLEKYKLVEWLINLKDERVISKLKAIKNSKTMSLNWSEETSYEEKLLVNKGLKDFEEGKTYTHEFVMEEIEKKHILIF